MISRRKKSKSCKAHLLKKLSSNTTGFIFELQKWCRQVHCFLEYMVYTMGCIHQMFIFLLTVSETSVPDQHHNYFGIIREAFCYQCSLFSQWEASSPSRYATCQHECALHPSRKEVSRGGIVGVSWFALGIREVTSI